MSNFQRGGRKARAGVAPSMRPGTDPRERTNAVHGRTGDDLGAGLSLDRQGRQIVRVNPVSGLRIGPDGSLDVDHSKFAQAAAAASVNNITIAGGGSGGGGSGTTIINNTFILDDTLAGYAL